MPQLRRSRGRLKGLQNCQHLINFEEQFITAIKSRDKLLMAFITAKEKANFKLTKQLQKEGRIITLGAPFQASNK